MYMRMNWSERANGKAEEMGGNHNKKTKKEQNKIAKSKANQKRIEIQTMQSPEAEWNSLTEPTPVRRK